MFCSLLPPPSPGRLMAYSWGLQLYLLHLLVPSSPVLSKDQDFTWEFSPLAHKYTTTELLLCVYACTVLAFLPWKCSMGWKSEFLQVSNIFGALKNEHCSVFMLLFLKHFISEYISNSQCNAALCFLCLDLNEFVAYLFVWRLYISVLFTYYWKNNCILYMRLLEK